MKNRGLRSHVRRALAILHWKPGLEQAVWDVRRVYENLPISANLSVSAEDFICVGKLLLHMEARLASLAA
ncbi:hypothetical protein [Calothrix sp. NIES-2098]|uniref:hypothetical protein n=1 Tax=Calothrix sp. NIES-2098 TaxID=1954171 RepID=UPI0030D7E1DC